MKKKLNPLLSFLILGFVLILFGATSFYAIYNFKSLMGQYQMIGLIFLIVLYLVLIAIVIKEMIINKDTLKHYALFFVECICCIIILFATIYTSLYYSDNNAFDVNCKIMLSQKNDVQTYFHFIYYSIITITTVGYGDTVPISFLARLVSALESLLSYVGISCILLGGMMSLNKGEKTDE